MAEHNNFSSKNRKRTDTPRNNSYNSSFALPSHRPHNMNGPGNGGGSYNNHRPSAPGAPIKTNLHLDPFDLFCSLYLGITPDGGYRPQTMHEIARRYSLSLDDLRSKLVEMGLDAETIQQAPFELELAQYDIKVAPEGISRRELARPWFEEYQKINTKQAATAKPSIPPNKTLLPSIFDEEA